MTSKTRMPFRVLALVIGVFGLCFCLPVALIDADLGTWERVFFVACSFIGGVGLLMAAYSVRWFNSSA